MIVEEKNKEITDSITYAKRLQNAIMPSESLIKEHLPDSFIFYKPKAIVAGDFYWMNVSADRSNILFAVADSTGHGVPGAMVSIVCSNALNRSVNEFGLTDPGKILDKTRELVLETFATSDEDVTDGMDISLVSIEGTRIRWAGANNPLWYIRSGEFGEITAHKQPIGKTDDASTFPTHTIELGKGDMVYLITDGYPDQFGGPKGKKFKYQNLKNLFIEIHSKPVDQQLSELNSTFDTWKGGLEQVDDVTIVGLKI
jgi:serine phosphatase RsbU (regulator of sigma subunit)